MPALGRYSRELRSRLWKPPVEEEVRSELANHLELLELDLVNRGMSVEEARVAARRQFGDVDRIEATCRDLGNRRDGEMRRTEWWNEFRYDVRHALRQLRASPRFTFIAILTLAVGLGASTTIFGVANAVLLRALPFPDPDRLALLYALTPPGRQFAVAEPDYLDWSARSRSFASVGAFSSRSPSLVGDGGPEQLQGVAATHTFFQVLGVAPALGRAFLPEEDRKGGDSRVAVISDGLWQRRFGGDRSVIGRQIDLDGVRHRVVGVMPRGFDFPARNDVWVPLVPVPEYPRGDHRLELIGRLAPGATIERADRELAQIAKQVSAENPGVNVDWSAQVRPFKEWYVSNRLAARVIALLATVALLLAMSCVNVANLLLSRAAVREHELAIRAALGAGRGRIVRQLLTESLVLASLGAVAGVAVAAAAVPVIRRVGGVAVPRLSDVAVDWAVLSYAVPTCLLTGLIFGLVPALRLSGLGGGAGDRLHDVIRSGTRVAESGRLRNTLIVTSVALAMLLLVGAGLVGGSFLKLMRVDLGFNPANVLTASIAIPEQRYDQARRSEGDDQERTATFFAELTRRLRAIPGVRAAGATNIAPFSGGNTAMGFDAAENVKTRVDDYRQGSWRVVTPGYFQALEIPLERGRYFTTADVFPSPDAVIINETLARTAWPDGTDPIGRRLALGNGREMTVVGIVGDTRHVVLDSVPGPTMYYPHGQFPWKSMWLTVRTSGDPNLVAAAVRREVAALDAKIPLANVRPLTEFVSETSAEPRLTMLIFGIFATSALVLAAVGLYGIVSYTVSQRTREIGVSVALGARPEQIVRGVLAQGMRLAAAGVVIGGVAAYGGAGVLRTILFATEPTDGATYAVVGALLLVVGAVASAVPARRASRLDPMQALRGE